MCLSGVECYLFGVRHGSVAFMLVLFDFSLWPRWPFKAAAARFQEL